jgi:hypothetical protein
MVHSYIERTVIKSTASQVVKIWQKRNTRGRRTVPWGGGGAGIMTQCPADGCICGGGPDTLSSLVPEYKKNCKDWEVSRILIPLILLNVLLNPNPSLSGPKVKKGQFKNAL